MASPSASASALRVLTDTWLLRYIVAFQTGFALNLRDYYQQLEAKESQAYPQTRIQRLVDVIVDKGTVEHLDLLRCARLRNPFSKRRDMEAMSQSEYALVARLAIQHNRVDMLQWTIDHDVCPRGLGSVPCDSVKDMWEAALAHYRPADTRVLELLRTARPVAVDMLVSMYWQESAVVRVDLHQLQWLHEHYAPITLPLAVATSAAKRGDVAVIQYLIEQQLTQDIEVSVFKSAFDHDHFAVLESLLQKSPGVIASGPQADLLQQHMVSDNRPEVQALFDKHPDTLAIGWCQRIAHAVQDNELALLRQWLHAGRLAKHAPISIDRAARYGSLDTIRFLHDHRLARVTAATMDEAAEGKQWHVVEFLHTHRSEGCTTRAMDAAAEFGDVERVRWFHENRSEGCSQEAVRLAAVKGHVGVLRFLHEYTNAGCSTDAMDGAAAHGRLDAVAFLHEHRPEGCTTAAMDQAAANGHAAVVEFLAQNRSEGCSNAAIQCALKRGHDHVVRVLYHHYPHLFGPDLLGDLLRRGICEIYSALSEKYPARAHAVVEKAMFQAGRELNLTTIRFIVHTLGRKDVAFRAMDGAALCCNERWVVAVYAIAGPESCRLSAVRNAVRSSDLYQIPFLVDVCCEPGARETAITAAEGRLYPELVALMANDWDQFVSEHAKPADHPFFHDPRTPDWAIELIVDKEHQDFSRLDFCAPFTWAVRAVFQDDLALLEVVRDLPPSTVEQYLHPQNIDEDEYEEYAPFSYEGARVAAVRFDNLSALEWLIENVDLPVEPTLLCEAIFFRNFEIAEWLVEHHPEACKDYDSEEVTFGEWWSTLDQDVLDWLEANDRVRCALPPRPLIEDLAVDNNAAGLRRFFQWFPSEFMSIPGLRDQARTRKDSPYSSDVHEEAAYSETVAFLDEIGYPRP